MCILYKYIFLELVLQLLKDFDHQSLIEIAGLSLPELYWHLFILQSQGKLKSLSCFHIPISYTRNVLVLLEGYRLYLYVDFNFENRIYYSALPRIFYCTEMCEKSNSF